MPETSVIRVLRFHARHRYWKADWPEARNRERFGALVESHPHDYRVEVAVTGAPDPETGFLVDLAAFDAALGEVLAPFADGDLNAGIPEVKSGEILPSTEALANWVWRRLEGRLPDGLRLRRVAVWESDELGSEVTHHGR